MLQFLTVLFIVLSAPSLHAWIVSHPMIKLNALGSPRLEDAHGDDIYIVANQPRCEVIGIQYQPESEGGTSPLPKGIPLYMVVITDPEHDDEMVNEGCVYHPNGPCIDALGRTSYRFLDDTSTELTGHGTNFCVPKGWCGENCNDCDETLYPPRNIMWPDGAGMGFNDGFCQTWVEGVTPNPSNPSGSSPMNPSGEQGDCHFGHESIYFNYNVTNCRVEPFQIGVIQDFDLHEVDIAAHWIVVVEGDDAVVNANGTEPLKMWARYKTDDCNAWQSQYNNVEVVEECGAYHAMSTMKLDDNSKHFDEANGVGFHCAGHKSTKCSPKHFPSDSIEFPNPKEHCRIKGCKKVAGAGGDDTCEYGDMLLSANFEFTGSLAVHDANVCNPADQRDDERFFTIVASFEATQQQLSTTGDFQQEPSFCCDVPGIHVPAAPSLPPTNPPVPRPTPENYCGVDNAGKIKVLNSCVPPLCKYPGDESCVADNVSNSEASVSASVHWYLLALALLAASLVALQQ